MEVQPIRLAGFENTSVLIQVTDLKKYFPITTGIIFSKQIGRVKAVDGISFTIVKGETLALVGESGCGKSTAGRLILRLIKPTSGRVVFEGRDLIDMKGSELRQLRREMQIIFQDPYASLNPRLKVVDIVGEPLKVNGICRNRDELFEKVSDLLKVVGLSPYHRERFPYEFSGGQRQRIGIARALGVNPKLIVADEPVSALDVSIQSQVINLLQDLQRDYGMAYLFIAHDLAVVKHIAHRVAVMYLGKLMEVADKKALFSTPYHPYSQALLSAVPIPDPESKSARIILKGDVPSPSKIPPGCRFHTRCPIAQSVCEKEEPVLTDFESGHFAACHFARPFPLQMRE
jgi:oligopeptide transport system ATP-binding protein